MAMLVGRGTDAMGTAMASNPKLFESEPICGPAEPGSPTMDGPTIGCWLSTELTLRDLFAAFALAGLIGYYGNQGSGAGVYCYELADAMLAERERKP